MIYTYIRDDHSSRSSYQLNIIMKLQTLSLHLHRQSPTQSSAFSDPSFFETAPPAVQKIV